MSFRFMSSVVFIADQSHIIKSNGYETGIISLHFHFLELNS